MKLFYSLIFALVVALPVQSQWNVSYNAYLDNPGASSLYNLQFPDASRGYAWIATSVIGPQTKSLLYTDDLGDTWDTVAMPFEDFRFLRFFDADNGYWVTNTVAYHTSNGGQTWDTTGPMCSSCILHYPQMASNGKAYVIGVSTWSVQDSIWVYESTDMGQNWNLHAAIQSPAPGFISDLHNLHHPSFLVVNDSTFLFAGPSRIYRTTDHGQNWWVTTSGFGLRGLQQLSDSVFHAYDDEAFFLRSSDQGQNWDTVTTPATNPVTDILFHNENVGYVATYGLNSSSFPVLKFLRTGDGGNNWTEDSLSNQLTTLFELAVLSADTAFATSSGDISGGHPGIIVRTFNGGIPDTNTAVPSVSAPDFSAIAFPNPTSNQLTVEWNDHTESRIPDQLIILDAFGRQVMAEAIDHRTAGPNGRFALDVSPLASGVYFFQLSKDGQSLTTQGWIKR